MKNDLAIKACEALVQAYKNGERNAGSVDWNDLDWSHTLAMRALGKRNQDLRRKKRKVPKK